MNSFEVSVRVYTPRLLGMEASTSADISLCLPHLCFSKGNSLDPMRIHNEGFSVSIS